MTGTTVEQTMTLGQNIKCYKKPRHLQQHKEKEKLLHGSGSTKP